MFFEVDINKENNHKNQFFIGFYNKPQLSLNHQCLTLKDPPQKENQNFIKLSSLVFLVCMN